MNKKILNLAVPNILANLSVPLLSAVDIAVVGHLTKTSFIGAIAVGSMIFNVLFLGLGFLRMGTTAFTSQAYGSLDKEESVNTLGRGLVIAFSIGLAMIILQNYIASAAFNIVDTPEKVEYYARQYFDIRIYAAPATLSIFVFQGWFLGMQNARYPLYVALTVNILNIILDFVFVFELSLRVEGVALGTAASQYMGFILCLLLFNRQYINHIDFLDYRQMVNITRLKKFFRVNGDIFIRTISLIFVLTFFTAMSTELGTDILALNTILMQLWMFVSYGVDGFAFASESLVGKYYGRRDPDSIKKVVNYNLLWGLGLGSIFFVVYALFFEPIVHIFTDKENIHILAKSYYWWIVLSPLVNSISFIWDGIYLGATATRVIRNAMIFSSFIIFLPIFYLTVGSLGNHALWLALFAFMVSRGLSLTIFYKKAIIKRV